MRVMIDYATYTKLTGVSAEVVVKEQSKTFTEMREMIDAAAYGGVIRVSDEAVVIEHLNS